MAIATGINGTLAQDLRYDPIEPIYFRTFKKTVPVDNGWEDRVFYAITKVRTSDMNQAIDWCKKHYGERRYSDTWWYTHGEVIMNEKIYIHYKLME